MSARCHGRSPRRRRRSPPASANSPVSISASDLSRLNAAGGRWTYVGRRLLEALDFALRAREDTGGRFDPTVLPALVAAGYDRSFELLDERPAEEADGWCAGTAIELDERRGRARLEPGSAVDLGGIGKGYAAGRALDAMRAASSGLAGGLVDLGGDIAVWGESPEGGPWLIAVADPRRAGETLAVLALDAGGGVATSGRDARRFGPARSLHHLIDPETGESALAGPLTVTVVAPDPVAAEVHATTLAIAGPGRGGRVRRRQTAARRALRSAHGAGDPARTAATRVAAPDREGGVTAVPVAWLVARAAGLVAFGLLTLSVWLGLAMSTRLLGPKRTKPLLALHRTLAWTGLSMVGLHLGAILLDPVMHFGALGALVPGMASWRPAAVALGVVSAWLSLALAASFNARRWIGQKGWRRLHYATFAAFWLALGHALLVGTDLKGFGGPLTAVLAAAPVLWLSFYRLLTPRPAPPRPAAAALPA